MEEIRDASPSGSQQEIETVNLVHKLLNRSKRHSAKIRSQIAPDRDFVFESNQWPSRLPKYRHQEVMNFTFSVIQSIIPVMTDNRPMINCVPVEPSDRDFSVMLTGVIEDLWDRISIERVVVDVITDGLTSPAGIAYVGWDKEAEDGIGQTEIRAVDPMYCYPDPHSVNIQDGKFFIYTEPTYVGELKRKYPDKADEIHSSKTKPKSSVRDETAYVEFDDGYSLDDYKKDDDDQDDTLLIRCWLKDEQVIEEQAYVDGEIKYIKKKKYPNGRYMEVANGLLLKDGENEFKDGLFPFAKFVDHAVPRSFWGISEVKMLKSPQRILNKLSSWMLDALNITGKPIWIVDTSAQVDINLITNEPGLVIPKTPGSEVRREPGIDIPPSMMNLFQMTKSAYDAINGLGELSQGSKPAGVTSGVAIESLQEAAQNRIRQKNRNLESFLKDMGKLIISRIMQFYKTKRLIRITENPAGIPEFFEFSIDGERARLAKVEVDDNGQTNYMDVREAPVKGFPDIKVLIGSSLPYAKAQKAQLALQLFERQIIDAEEVLDAIQWPNAELVLERQKAKMQQMAEVEAQNEGGV